MSDTDRFIGALQGFQEATEKRLDSIEFKVDRLSEFYWKISGGAFVVSCATAAAVEFFKYVWGK